MITYLFVGFFLHWVCAQFGRGNGVVALFLVLKSVTKIHLRPATLAKERVRSGPNVTSSDYNSVILIWHGGIGTSVKILVTIGTNRPGRGASLDFAVSRNWL